MNVVIIPARYASTRFPGKPLARIAGHAMIWHVYHRCQRARRVDAVWVATDDERIYREVSSWGGKVIMTRPDHPSGTDRVAEAASDLDAEIIVNVQGDEPLMEPDVIDALVEPLSRGKDVGIATPITQISSREELFDPSVAKVVRDKEGFALYFSRAAIPFARGNPVFLPGSMEMSKDEEQEIISRLPLFRHIGVYAYRRETLFEFCRLNPSPLEQTEKLEQLRALENSMPILTVEVSYKGVGVDTKRDLKRVEEILRARQS